MSESVDEGARPRARGARIRAWLAGAALALGASAFAITAVHQAAGPFQEPPQIEQAIADKARSIYERAREAILGEPAPAPAPAAPVWRNIDQRLRGLAAGLGAVAAALALAGFARRESPRLAAGALVLGTAALPWQTGLAFAVALVFVALVVRLARSDAR